MTDSVPKVDGIEAIFAELRIITNRPNMAWDSFRGCFLSEENARQFVRPLWQTVVHCPQSDKWCVVENRKCV